MGICVKPLPVLPLTEEDGDIWWEVLMRLKTRKDTSARSLFYVSEDCDRRDAELMFFAQRWGGCCIATAVGNGTMVRCCERIRGEFAGFCGDRAVYDGRDL